MRLVARSIFGAHSHYSDAASEHRCSCQRFRFVDTPRTYASLLFSLYRTLGNILTRQRTELQRIQPLLDKRGRTDVQTNIDQYMTRDERAALEEYYVQRERLSTLAQRVDESVFVLRDLAEQGYAGDDPYVPIDPMLK